MRKLTPVRNTHFTDWVVNDPRSFENDYDKCVFENCQFADIEEITSTFSFRKFINCEFNDVRLYWALLHDNQFIDCTLAKTVFAGAMLKDSMFLKCNFKSAVFIPSNLGEGCDLSGVVIRNCEASHFVSYNSKFDIDDEISSILIRKTIEDASLEQLAKLSFGSA